MTADAAAPDATLVGAWLAARSIARALPPPVAVGRGWRVASGQVEERRRYLFVAPDRTLCRLGRVIDAPQVALKLCAEGSVLMALLPARWRLAHDNWMMVWEAVPAVPPMLPPGYALTFKRDGAVNTATIHAHGLVVASGRGVAHGNAYAYDQIETAPAHRRRGLATAIVRALGRAAAPSSRHVLTATPDGRALYRTLGWREYTPYATAVVADGA